MGYRNLEFYYRDWVDHPDIGHVAQRMLAYMVFRAADDANPPIYYEGPEALIRACGMTKGKASIKTMKRNAQRSLKELKDAGAIVSSEQAGPGVRENYALTLDPTKTAIPEGKGRNVTWRVVDVHPEPRNGRSELPPSARSGLPPNGRSELPPSARSGLPRMGVQDCPEWAATVNAPKEDQTNSNESSNADGQKFQMGNRLLDASLDGQNSNFGLDDEPENLTPSQERNRQMAALQKLMAQESATAQTR